MQLISDGETPTATILWFDCFKSSIYWVNKHIGTKRIPIIFGVSSGVSSFCKLSAVGARWCRSILRITYLLYVAYARLCVFMHLGAKYSKIHYESPVQLRTKPNVSVGPP
jgi:hypothetical protein